MLVAIVYGLEQYSNTYATQMHAYADYCFPFQTHIPQQLAHYAACHTYLDKHYAFSSIFL
jgi:hypothetical protein